MDEDPRLRATIPNRQAPSQNTGSGSDARLVFVDGPRRGDILPLCDEMLRLGRQLDNEIVIDSERVSRHHARLERNQTTNRWTLVDLSSVNGTAVNGVRLAAETPRSLQSHDVVQLPEVTLIFLQDSAIAGSEKPAPRGRVLQTIHLDDERIRAEADEAIRKFLDSGGG